MPEKPGTTSFGVQRGPHRAQEAPDVLGGPTKTIRGKRQVFKLIDPTVS